MPGIVRTFEGDKIASIRRRFGDDVIQGIAVAKEAQAAAFLGPARLVEVKQASDQLILRIGVDAAVPALTMAAYGNHQRPVGKIDVEFLGDEGFEFRALDLFD